LQQQNKVVCFWFSASKLTGLRLLKEHGLLSKCMIIMPPALHVLGLMTDERKWMRNRWDEVRRQCPELRLPEYDPDEMVYVPSPDFSVGPAMSLRGWMSTIVEALDELLPSKGFRSLPICQAIAELTEMGFRWRDRERRVLEGRHFNASVDHGGIRGSTR